MSNNDVAISRLAQAGTPQFTALAALDEAGDRNGAIGVEEIQSLSCSAPPAGLTSAQVRALQTTFVNVVSPSVGAGVRLNGCTPSRVLPTSGEVRESTGTAVRKYFGVGAAFPNLYVTDTSGNDMNTMSRRWASNGAKDFFQNVFGVTLTLREGSDTSNPNAVIAEAHPRIIDTKNLGNNFRTLIDINDGSGQRIGTIRQTWESLGGSILQNMVLGGSIWTTYEILDANEQVIARSAKTEFFGANMNVTGNDGQPAAGLQRQFVQSLLRDRWHFVANDGQQIDRRVLAFMAAYKTMADIQRTDAAARSFWGEVIRQLAD